MDLKEMVVYLEKEICLLKKQVTDLAISNRCLSDHINTLYDSREYNKKEIAKLRDLKIIMKEIDGIKKEIQNGL